MIKRDLVAFTFALLVHALFGVGLAMTPRRPPGPDKLITVDVRKKALPQTVQPKPEPPKPELPKPQPPKPKKPEIVKAPIPNKEPPKELPKEPAKPVFGVTMESTTEGPGDFVVPVGNTTVADPSKTAKKGEAVQPLAAAPPAAKPAPEYVPVSDLDISSAAEVDDDPISTMPYPEGEARNLGIEGDTRLSIVVDANGRVREVKIVGSVGGGPAGKALDELARTMAYKLKFKPARDKAGRPVVSRVSPYKVNWILNR